MRLEDEKEAIITRYLDNETVGKIARDYGVNRKSIHKKLHEWGVPARNPKCAHTGRKKRVFTAEEEKWITDAFLHEGRLLKSLAEELNVWEGCVRRVLVNHQIRVKVYNPTEHDKANLVRLYSEGVSLDDFQEMLGISRSAATRLLRESGVEIRSRGKVTVYKVQNGKKQCGRCRKYKDTACFGKNEADSQKLQSSCRDCSAEISTRNKLKRKHGFTQTRYTEVWESQRGLCAICKKPETRTRLGKPCRLVVDHNHATGKIRELLCSSCNQALGLIHEDLQTLDNMKEYIIRHAK